MYIVVLILRELRRLFHDKSVKRFFTIIILCFAIYMLLAFFGVLPDRVAFGAEEITSAYYYDGVQATYKDYESLQNDFVIRMINLYEYNGGSFPSSTLNTLNRMCNGGFSVMFWYGDSLGTAYQNTYPSVSQKNTIEVIFMDASQVSSNVVDYDWGLNGVQGVRGYLCNTTYYEAKFVRTNFNSYTLNANTARHFLPSYLVDYKSQYLCEFLEFFKNGRYDSMVALKQAIENQTTKIEEQTEVIQETQNTINDSSVDNTIVDSLPESNINDVTADGLNTIFSDVMDALVNPIVENIRVKVPFTNKYFEISSDLVYGQNNSYVPEWIRTIVSMFWYYILSVYIVKDIAKIIDNLKNGRFESVASGNIKEDML